MNRVQVAALIARSAHDGQERVYGEPYIVHPMRVAGRVTLLSDASEDMIIAAWLHDVLEDTKFDSEVIRVIFGDVVSGFVHGLTNVKYEGLTRDEKKHRDRLRLSAMPDQVKIIKLADRIDNMRDCVLHADVVWKRRPKMAPNYVAESKLLLPHIQVSGHPLVEEYLIWLERMTLAFSNR